jgi:hypothetical protein
MINLIHPAAHGTTANQFVATLLEAHGDSLKDQIKNLLASMEPALKQHGLNPDALANYTTVCVLRFWRATHAILR